MLNLNLTAADPSFWITVAGVLWKVCPLTRTQERALAKKHTKIIRANGQVREELDEEYLPSRAKLVIKDWQGLADNGVAIERSDDVIDNLCERYPNLIMDVLAEASNVYAERNEEHEKNSETGASGTGAPSSKKGL